jgi:hypothetical protein
LVVFAVNQVIVYILYPITLVLFIGGVMFSYLTVLQVALKFLILIADVDVTEHGETSGIVLEPRGRGADHAASHADQCGPRTCHGPVTR